MDSKHSDKRDSFTVSMLPLESFNNVSMTEKDPKFLFNLHRRIPIIPIIKRNVTVEELMEWDPAPLIESLSLAAKELKDSVKTIDKLIADILSREKIEVPFESINELLHIGLFENNGILRDEVYLQLMRRINGIKMKKGQECLWKLLLCVTASFPPSKGLSPYVLHWFNQFNESNDPFTQKVLKNCYCNFNVFLISGPRGYSTTVEDVKFWYDGAIDKLPLFGVDLDEIYQEECLIKDFEGLRIPKIVVKLVEMIKELNGYEKEGIFRVSGDLQQVFRLKVLLSMDSDSVQIGSFKDASVPCSTLKLWMRVLKGPLIPDGLYPQFLVSRANPKRLAVLLEEKLAKSNYAVISYICNFLIELAAPEHQNFTKMTLDNFSMIFAPCFMRCPLSASALEVLRRSSEERQVLREIFNHFISINHKN